MRRVVLFLATALTAAAMTACGGGDVTVMAQLEGASTGTQETGEIALSSLPVRLLPFDRDAVFDSLARAFPEPEPEIPDSIVALQDRVIETQTEWREAQERWSQVRDSLQTLSDSLSDMSQSDADYFVLFQDFNDLEAQVNGLERRANSAFEQFETLQARLNQQAREIELARENWASEAFQPVDSIFTAREEELRREVQYDTTNGQGVARFSGVDSGEWWVNARYDRQFDELYWNVQIDVEGGEEVTVRLTEENAEVRQKL